MSRRPCVWNVLGCDDESKKNKREKFDGEKSEMRFVWNVNAISEGRCKGIVGYFNLIIAIYNPENTMKGFDSLFNLIVEFENTLNAASQVVTPCRRRSPRA